MKQSKLIGSAGSLDQLTTLISKYFMGSSITLQTIEENQWSVSNSKGQIEGCVVRFHRGRYRFEMI